MPVEPNQAVTILEQKQSAIRSVLDCFVEAKQDSLSLFVSLFDELRPSRPRDALRGIANHSYFIDLLEKEDSYREAVRERTIDFLDHFNQVSFYTDAGILPSSGFFSELGHRIAQRLLPDVPDPNSMHDAMAAIFHWRKDYLWMDPARGYKTDFWRVIHPLETPRKETLWKTLNQLLEALQVLAVRVAALGVEPELLRILPDLTRHASPFLALSAESQRFVDAYQASHADGLVVPQDEGQLLVLIEQCEDTVERARKKASRLGTSMGLTYILVRLWQNLRRIKLLGGLLGSRLKDRSMEEMAELWTEFFHDAALGVIRRNSIRDHVATLIGLLALRVTENASRTGEHYIMTDRTGYRRMFRSAAGAGLLIGSMALLKIMASKLPLAPLLQAIAFSMNYAACFVAVYMLHFTIATKQPAMTAATLASSIGEAGSRRRKWDEMVDLIVDTIRSQCAAICGNVFVAFPVAILILLGWNYVLNADAVSLEKADHLLHDLHPIHSLAVFHAAIAGFYLFLSGLISGYFDNQAAYARIGERISALHWLRKTIGSGRADRMGQYIDDHLGGLMGNTLFGVMLGCTGIFGQIAGLPLDIRHIAFSAANFGYALVAFQFRIDPPVLLWSILGIILIGITNLAVSFAFALWTALRSRGIRSVPFRPILRLLWERWRAQPRIFFHPPGSMDPK